MGEDEDRDETSGEPGESEKERVDRELIELLNELRVVLPGVQVLFAFLLTVPFSNGFAKMTDTQRDWYVVAFLCATVATALLIAPSTYHRIMFRKGGKQQMLYTSNKLVLGGTVFLAASMASSVYLISDVFFGLGPAGSIAGVAAAVFIVAWYVLPLWRRARAEDESPESEE